MSDNKSPEEYIPVGVLHPQPRKKTGYVERLKIQRNRLKNINLTEDSSTAAKSFIPKIKKNELERVNITALSRGGTLDTIKLPSVISDKSSRLSKKDEVFIKSLCMFPGNVAFLSKSLPSLPSIPGSPGLEDLNSIFEDETLCPPTPVYHSASKNKYQTIATQKQLEHRNGIVPETEELHVHRTERLEKRYIKNKSRIPVLEKDHSFVSVQSVPVPKYNNITDNLPRRYRKQDRSVEKQRRFRSLDARSDALSVKSDSILNSVKPKWNENCDCLRCKMLKRQFKDGDDMYKVWGQYPCCPQMQDDD